MSVAEWVQVLTGAGTFIGVVLLLAKNAGIWQAKREVSETTLETKADALERSIQEEHTLRRDMNRDIGKLDVRLSKAEVRIDDYGRRLTVLEGMRSVG